MNKKVQVVTAYLLSLVMVFTSFMEFVVPAKAADSGFSENAVIISDKAVEYCWLDSEVNLSVNVIKGTNLQWSIDREGAGVTLTEKEDVEDRTGIIKNLSVAIGADASGSYKITANAGNDQRTITLNVCNSLSDIQGAVVTDFNNQYTENSFEVKAVVDPRYADTFQWGSTDDTKMEVKAEEDKTSTTEYAGSVVKYAMVNIKSEKPANGACDIKAVANGIEKAQTVAIKKSATNIKDLQVVATSYQKEDANFDLNTYNHMTSDALYVDMDETITLTCVVEGTVVNPNVAVGESLSANDVDDCVGLASTESNTNKESTGAAATTGVNLTKLSDTSYQAQFDMKGENATNIQNPIVFSVVTISGKRSIRKNLIVLAPAMNVASNVKGSDGKSSYYEASHTNVGLLSGENVTVNTKDFNALWTLKFESGLAVVTQNDNNIASCSYDMLAGTEKDITASFRSRFKVGDNTTGKYICDSTDTPLWKSMDETIATVTKDGKIKAVKGGDTRVYCYAAPTKTSPRTNIYAYVNIHVTDLTEAEGVNITKEVNGEQKVIAEDTIYTTQKNIQYSAQLINGSATANEPVIWESSDKDIFEVGASGVVNPKKAGTATLTVTTQKSGYTSSIRITVKDAIESIKIPEREYTGTYVQNHTYTLTTILNDGKMTETEEAVTWTIEDQSESDPTVVFIDPNDSTQKELTKFVGRNVHIKIKKRGSAKVVVKGAINASAIDTLNVTAIAERPATSTVIKYNDQECSGKEFDVVKGTNVELKASLLAENGQESTDDFYWNIVQEGNVVSTTNTTLENVKTLTLQPLTKGDVTVELRNKQSNKLLTVTFHVKVPATSISLKEGEYKEIMMVPGETGATGVTYQLTPQVLPEDTSDVVTYESSNPEIVKVDENGLLTAVKSSEIPVTITAKINDKLQASCQVRVAIPITEISATDHKGQNVEDKGTVNVYVDGTGSITLNCGNATEYIDWTSDNERIASVKASDDTYSCTINGNVAGTTTIRAVSTVSKKTMQFTVNVVNKITSITLSGNASVSYDNKNAAINATVTPNSNFDEILWTVDNTDILEVTPFRQGNTARAIIVPKKPGTATITATSADGLVSDKYDVTITAVNLSMVTVKVDTTNAFEYNGKSYKPEVVVSYRGVELQEGTDYNIAYKDDVNAGSATVVITGGNSGCYVGTKEVRYTITKRSMDKATVKLSASAYEYTGTAVVPELTVTDLGKTLKEGTDYTVSCTGNMSVGTAKVRIMAVGSSNYQGSKELSFQIKAKNLSKVKVASIPTQTYTGKALTPVLKVTNGTAVLSANRDYTVKYSANKKTGKAKAVLTGMGNYTGKKTVYFYIAPAVPTNIQVQSTAAKTLKIKWKRDSKATGYQIYYGTNNRFTKRTRKTVDIKKYRTTSKTVKKLKSGKTYYVKMRAYKKVGSKKVYGAWSGTYQTIIQ